MAIYLMLFPFPHTGLEAQFPTADNCHNHHAESLTMEPEGQIGPNWSQAGFLGDHSHAHSRVHLGGGVIMAFYNKPPCRSSQADTLQEPDQLEHGST